MWLAVLFGTGIGLYFALPVEPPLWTGATAVATVILTAFLLRRKQAFLIVLIGLSAASAGFAAACLRAALVEAPVLASALPPLEVEGTVVAVERQDGGAQRVVLDRLRFEPGKVAAAVAPLRVRLRLLAADGAVVVPGMRIAVKAALAPPSPPAAPGAFDFARHAWFQQLGAVGYAVGRCRVLPAPEGGWLRQAAHWVERLRQSIGDRVRAAIPGAEGAVAAALINGGMAAIPDQVMDDYRDSGLAHLLSISGLHMSLVAGLVFLVVRGGLALVPPLALRHPIKKWAAVAALAVTFFYLLLAGAPVPTQRSFLMTGIVLLAVLVDRTALSMRLVAWAAVAVLAYAPEMLVGASFQMSFAAVVALIAAYEALARPMARWREQGRGGLAGAALLYVGGIMLSTLVAGSATTPFALYHFGRMAVFSQISNLLAVPLTGFVVMPGAVLGVLLMPLGLESVALVPMGWGVAVVNRIAAEVASWPHAAPSVAAMPLWGLLAVTAGGLWLCLWRRRWRLLGVLPLAAGLLSPLADAPPDLLVDGRGKAVAVRGADGALVMTRAGGAMLRQSWQRLAGPLSAEDWPKAGLAGGGVLACDGRGCLAVLGGRTVALAWSAAALAEDCPGADLVVTPLPGRDCRGAGSVLDRDRLSRDGAHAVWLSSDGVRWQSVAAWQGRRPWAIGADDADGDD